MSTFPIDQNGKMDPSDHHRWMEQQRQLEVSCEIREESRSLMGLSTTNRAPVDGSTGSTPCVSQMGVTGDIGTGSSDEDVVPNGMILPQDVLLGRASKINNHPGNVQFRKLVALHAEEYDSSTKFEKTLVASRIVAVVRSTGGRFLKTCGDSWVEVGDTVSRKKAAQCFRTLRSKLR